MIVPPKFGWAITSANISRAEDADSTITAPSNVNSPHRHNTRWNDVGGRESHPNTAVHPATAPLGHHVRRPAVDRFPSDRRRETLRCVLIGH
ncbi:hypothetical protein GCM10027258_49150 [Amycolatopsis stemonae]